MEHFIHFWKRKKKQFGFTLIELIVVIAIVAVLIVLSIITLNPQKQLRKAQDLKISSDMHQIKIALDLYYNDTNCYPQTIIFGQKWISDTGTVYMTKIPTSVDSSNPYVYQADFLTSCPQWFALFAKLSYPSENHESCTLEKSVNCLPKNYASSAYNTCATAGLPDCNVISASVLPSVASVSATQIPTSPLPSLSLSPTPALGVCSWTPNGVCEANCAPGSDADCCTQKGYRILIANILGVCTPECYPSNYAPGTSACTPCSWTSDGTCPNWCAPGADADCCTQKGDYVLIANYAGVCGKGCYTSTYNPGTSACTPCSGTSDGTCPNWCAPGSDADCCKDVGKTWYPNYGCY